MKRKDSYADTRTLTLTVDFRPVSMPRNQKDTEVLMKTMYPRWFLFSNHHRKPDSLSGSLSDKKVNYARKITMISHQLIYESTAEDVFWILYSNVRGKQRLARISEDCSPR